MSDARRGRLRPSLAAVGSFLRGLPLLFCASPGTPLRVLAIIALDTLHVLRTSRPLLRTRRYELATMLDFQACSNAAWDGKRFRHQQHVSALRRLQEAGLGSYVEEYLSRLRKLESGRPPTGGDRRTFDHARAYREAVVQVSLATVTAVAFDTECLEEAIQATQSDTDVNTLFRMALLCQVIDDLVDYREDLATGLPSFLTATSTLSESMDLTARAARSYGAPGHAVFPLRMALGVISRMTQIVLVWAGARRWRGMDDRKGRGGHLQDTCSSGTMDDDAMERLEVASR